MNISTFIGTTHKLQFGLLAHCRLENLNECIGHHLEILKLRTCFAELLISFGIQNSHDLSHKELNPIPVAWELLFCSIWSFVFLRFAISRSREENCFLVISVSITKPNTKRLIVLAWVFLSVKLYDLTFLIFYVIDCKRCELLNTV